MIQVRQIESIPAGENPLWHDIERMGTHFGTNVMLLHFHHITKPCKSFIICNKETGERAEVIIENEPNHEGMMLESLCEG